jgi:exodeoxyribonuclease VII small subunit
MAKQTFEQAIKKLEKLVQELEAGDRPLEEALNKFEEGMKLSKFCAEKLDETEKKITVLLQNQKGGLQEAPFVAENENGDEA